MIGRDSMTFGIPPEIYVFFYFGSGKECMFT